MGGEGDSGGGLRGGACGGSLGGEGMRGGGRSGGDGADGGGLGAVGIFAEVVGGSDAPAGCGGGDAFAEGDGIWACASRGQCWQSPPS